MARSRVEPLWDRIERNVPKLAFYLVAFTLAWALGVEVAVVLPLAALIAWFSIGSGVHGLFTSVLAWGGLAAVVLASVWVAVAASRSERSLLAQLGAIRVPVGKLSRTKRALHDMSLAVGLKYPPPLYVLDTSAVNAFVLGKRPERAAVGVTRGMLETLTPDEERAVFANLLTRLADGQVLIATVVSSLMSPAWVWRSHDFARDDDRLVEALEAVRDEPEDVDDDEQSINASRAVGAMVFTLLSVPGVFVTELLYAGQMRQQILTCEAADAKGMLLLKDPRAMLSALRRVLPTDNYVRSASAPLAPLFFAWTGEAYLDERDPECRRIARMREVLGAEGATVESPGGAPVEDGLPPVAPRVG